ncbi:hypothetical protein PHMEG_0004765 [Phytophthora megakarya]|uniref:RxLR effector protein n=1 Tax=Phytophthora megakarya TaxID=4795 RepID=A0A225WT27_9STRA|nr:hypothetical protein PHMEG_0004765 [Phytophthora megakarya]
MAARLDPEDIYIKLGLAKMGYDDARNSPLFRRYEAYKTEFSLKAHDVKASGWMRNWLVRYRLGKLKSQAATEMKKADEQLAREQREYERWFRERFHPSYIKKKLGLDELAKPETSSNFRHFEMYQKLWDKRMNGVVDTVT